MKNLLERLGRASNEYRDAIARLDALNRNKVLFTFSHGGSHQMHQLTAAMAAALRPDLEARVARTLQTLRATAEEVAQAQGASE